MFQEIQNILKRLQLPKSPRRTEVAIAEAIVPLINFSLTKEDVRFRDSVVYLAVPPLVRNEIVLKKGKILSLLRDKTGEKITDIR